MKTSKKRHNKKNDTLEAHRHQQTTLQKTDEKSHDKTSISSVVDSTNFQANIQNFSVENIKSIVDEINNEINLEKKNGLKIKYNHRQGSQKVLLRQKFRNRLA